MTSKQFLEQGIQIARQIKAHLAELEMLREVATATGAIRYDTDKVIHSVTEARYERPVIRVVDLENTVRQEIRSLIDDVDEIRKAVALIEDTEVQNVIRMRYLADVEIDVIASRLNISRRTVMRRLDLGYAEIAKITGYPAPVRKRLPAEERHGDAKRIMREYYENNDTDFYN